MESLHLTYTEVVDVIPYRNLLIMQKDKMHVTYGQVIRKGAGKEMAARRRQAARERQAAMVAKKKQKEQTKTE